ncbi:imidazole glycerol phosphate synthase subunit HisH [Thalassospira sp. ER-Se-21-Dark]|uniref:imidazole glycerol phosphate synthase subunit HisH n=1 Tax=Thalassospira sp. ER-Se-21-Dark TaxID=2585190 RepID=UPI001B3080D9|nr:imidazole glycerol phosphate synthase subunit HisH [Thalassospira sp. ER-Se-21-Dark]MBP3125533.1 imidazole glycerol phosphate synthase subunit HisH [Thalassospira sp. ER-Se-21-Dark]
MSVAIIDYGSGNLRSCAKAFERAARETGFSDEIIVTDDPEKVRNASHIVLPGVGAYADCRAGLDAVTGMVDVLTEQVINGGKPFFGICVGMQLMSTVGREFVVTDGLDWISGEVVAIEPSDPSLKIPHMGWNELVLDPAGKAHPVLKGISDGDHAYFVHSYHMHVTKPDQRLASVSYGGNITAMIGRDNMIGTQFHPEKSQKTGLTIIGNFLGWKP